MSDEVTPDPSVAWNRVQMHLDKLFDSLAELEEGGGLQAAAKQDGWKPARVEKALKSLGAVRDLIDGEVRRTKAARRW